MPALSDVGTTSWLFFAVAAPALWAASIHCDKYLLQHHIRQFSAGILLIFTASVEVAALPVMWFFKPSVLAVSASDAILMILSGSLYMSAMFAYFHALQYEEASTVSPFFQTTPLFGYVLAYFLLGEQLSLLQCAGSALIICGVILVSLRFDARFLLSFRYRVVSWMLVCGFALAASTVVFKIGAIRTDFWTTTFWMYVGGAAFSAALLLQRDYRNQISGFGRSSGRTTLLICSCNELINLTGNLLMRYAALLAPLSLVQAVAGTTPVFVLLYAVAFSLLYPTLAGERLSIRGFTQKALAAGLVVAGGIMIALA